MKSSELIGEINRLRKEKNAVIMAHYYQTGEIQEIAVADIIRMTGLNRSTFYA